MKRAYQVCHHMAWCGFLLTFFFFVFQKLPVPMVAFFLLPFTFFAAAAAILNHMLPKEDRAVAKLSIRGAVYHPYLDFLLFTVIDLFFFSAAYPDLPLIPQLSYIGLFLYVIAWFCLLITNFF